MIIVMHLAFYNKAYLKSSYSYKVIKQTKKRNT